MPDTTLNFIIVSCLIRLMMWALRQSLWVKLIKLIGKAASRIRLLGTENFLLELIWCDICLGFWVSGFAVLVLKFYPIILSEFGIVNLLLSVLLMDFVNFVFWTGIKMIFGTSEATHA